MAREVQKIPTTIVQETGETYCNICALPMNQDSNALGYQVINENEAVEADICPECYSRHLRPLFKIGPRATVEKK